MATKKRPHRKNGRARGLYEVALFRAFGDSLYEKLLDECWESIRAVFDDPRVAEARRTFLLLFAEGLARQTAHGGEPRRPRRKKG
ncbi:MAG: hypothetical protein HY720_18075 [Planctomycetes bacterium]|nr:hypothetical protein [Planctomycetota bacterium]